MAGNESFYLRSPYGIDGSGRTAAASKADHLRGLIEAVLFTAPGERVNRPDFGAGLNQLVFGPASEELATATQLMVQSSLQRWLGELIQVEAVQVAQEDTTLRVSVQYIVRRSQQRQVETFLREMPT
jgi:phage baseplate assembly protein W